MIRQISRVQKIASGVASGVVLNTSLPISIKVMEKIGYNRYNLKFGNKNLSTKSMKNLKIGGEYWGEISSGNENIVINNLYEKPDLNSTNTLTNGLDLIERLINEETTKWFYEFIASELENAKNKSEFEIYTHMLLALQNGVIYIPFIYSLNFGVFHAKKINNIMQIYLIFSNFPPILFSFTNDKITKISTPFKKVARYLQDEFNVEVEIKNFEQLYITNNQIVDFKG
ncbi:MAG: hypothetical protein ACTTJC_01665 [Campylobacter sp.]